MCDLDPRAGALDRQVRYAILDALSMEKTALCELDDRHIQKSMQHPSSVKYMTLRSSSKVRTTRRTAEIARQSLNLDRRLCPPES